MSLRNTLALVSAISAFACLPAHAAAPVFAGELGSGVYAGSVAAESGPFTDGAQWSFWKFKADFMANVDITVTPNDASFDPFIAVWYGIETDTSKYFDMISSSMNTTFVASADGVGPFGPAGAGDPAQVSFTNDYGNDYFTLAIADYTDQLGAGQLGYSITAAVPEPETYAQLLAGLGLLAGAMRLRRKSR
jgi:hypothetical protein